MPVTISASLIEDTMDVEFNECASCLSGAGPGRLHGRQEERGRQLREVVESGPGRAGREKASKRGGRITHGERMYARISARCS